MNRPVVFRPQAERELLDAERWYEDRKPGLGRDFRRALDEVLARVAVLPLSFPKVHGDKHRALVPRFPYGLYFALVRDQVVVVGVAHGHRDPTVWTSKR
ncbi:MAG: type II toxin-antitoxin system RelE/ParE family toxin [Vicinamibacterales bacterium]